MTDATATSQQANDAAASRASVAKARVRTELLSEQSTALLQELHLLTRDGHLNADARRKLKQINHFCTLLRPSLESVISNKEDVRIVDAGSGNAYLSFVLYEVFLARKETGHITGIETRADLVKKCRERAGRLGFERMDFAHMPISNAVAALAGGGDDTFAGGVDAVISLHACDTATDDAIILGLLADADVIAVVPCCQAEIFNLLKGRADAGPFSPLWRTPFHRREFSAHLTNVIRYLVLEAAGYKVRATELVGWEHSAKNELLIARKHQRRNPRAVRQLGRMLNRLPPLPMKLLASLHPTLAGNRQ